MAAVETGFLLWTRLHKRDNIWLPLIVYSLDFGKSSLAIDE